MFASLITSELLKVLLTRLANARPEDFARAIRSFERATRKMPIFPSIAGFGLGVAVGAGVGVLFAPRSGRDTRAALWESLQAKIRSWRKTITGEAPPESEIRPATPTVSEQRARNGALAS
ncbi:MAG TPA: YtxH domain-containing protein [Polyangiaceae bacterium]|jgi:hypothetical protein